VEGSSFNYETGSSEVGARGVAGPGVWQAQAAEYRGLQNEGK
jgi:hypothetical protein